MRLPSLSPITIHRSAIAAEQFPGDRYRRDERHVVLVEASALQREHCPLRTVLERHVCKWTASQVSFRVYRYYCCCSCVFGFFLPTRAPRSFIQTLQLRPSSVPSAGVSETWKVIAYPDCIPTRCTTSGWRHDRSGARGRPHRRFRCAPSNTVSLDGLRGMVGTSRILLRCGYGTRWPRHRHR